MEFGFPVFTVAAVGPVVTKAPTFWTKKSWKVRAVPLAEKRPKNSTVEGWIERTQFFAL